MSNDHHETWIRYITLFSCMFPNDLLLNSMKAFFGYDLYINMGNMPYFGLFVWILDCVRFDSCDNQLMIAFKSTCLVTVINCKAVKWLTC